jgi:protein SCO1/2
MRARFLSAVTALLWAPGAHAAAADQVHAARGVVQEINLDSRQVVLKHEAISNYMAAMTMPFRVKDTNALGGLRPGEQITFSLHVTETESWVDGFHDEGLSPAKVEGNDGQESVTPSASAIMDCPLTNEMGRALRLGDFRGQALAVTFFYTRCPLPEFCPRLSRNFQEASAKLASMTNAPRNWHFFSISFDPQSDTPETLKAYAQRYDYDPARWNFLTGAPEQIAGMARAMGVHYKEKSGTMDHNFRTIIIDASGKIQMIFPMGGNLTDPIVGQMIEAAAVSSRPLAQNQNPPQ